MRVGNLLPGQQADIKITYVADVKIEGDVVRLLFPVSVAPRYHPHTEHDAVGTGSLAKCAEGLELQVVCIMPSTITRVESPTHSVEADLTRGPRMCVARLQAGATHLDKDFVLLVAVEDPHRPRLAVEKGADGLYACMLTLAPRLRLDELPAEFVFVVDRSGSMGGSKIAQAVSALQLFLRSLPADCHFNIVSFGSHHTLLFPAGSAKNSVETLRKATAEVAQMSADYGGTEIMAPLSKVLEAKALAGYARQVFVLTDGQVSNTSEVIKYVEGKNEGARCFALGLGEGASHELVEGLARAGRGLADFAYDGDRLETKVMKQLEAAMQPALTDVRVDWTVPEQHAPDPPATGGAEVCMDTDAPPAPSGGGGVFDQFKQIAGSLLNYMSPRATQAGKLFVQAPFLVPPVFSESRFLIFCLLPPGVAPPTKAVVHANTPDGVLAVELAPTPADIFEGNTLHTLAARELIRDLEEGRSFMHKAPGRAAPSEAAVRAEIIRLATTYGLASKHTSFVAVEENTRAEVPLYYGPIITLHPADRDRFRGRRAAFSSQFGCMAASMALFRSSSGGGGGVRKKSASKCAERILCSDAMCFGSPPPAPGSSAKSFGSVGAKQSASSPPPSPASSSGLSNQSSDNGGDLSLEPGVAESGPVPPKQRSAQLPSTPQQTNGDKLSAIVLQQGFDGSWSSSPSLAKDIGIADSVLSAVPEPLKGNTTIWTTVLVLAFLSKKLADLQEDWNLVAKKARKWILSQVSDAELKQVLTAAEALV
jgi:uncharacterized protein YegL